MLEAAKRPLAHLSDLAKKYPHVWHSSEYLRSLRGQGLPDWPNYCYLPIDGGIGVATRKHEPTTAKEEVKAAWAGAIIAALAAWRQTKGIYQFHPELLDALWDTPVTGDLPVSVLKRLPEWCVYLHLEHTLHTGQILHGAWVHLEWDTKTNEEELRLLLDLDEGLTPIPLALKGSLKDSIDHLIDRAGRDLNDPDERAEVEDVRQHLTNIAEPILNLTLYLCSEEPEIDGRGKPGNPRPTKTKKGWRTFPANQPRTWNVGARIGAALQTARQQTAADHEPLPSGRQRPRPHIRRAHWKLYWTGPRTAPQTPILHWIPPTLVAADPRNTEELPATIRPVTPHAPERHKGSPPVN